MMNDHIKLPENNYAFKKVYGNDAMKLKDIKYIKDTKGVDLIKKPTIPIQKTIEYTSQDYKPKPKLDTSSIDFCDKEIQTTYKFELDMFRLSDYEFVNWANQQRGDFLIMAVMAEMKKSPKMRDEIERLRPEVYKIPLMPIHEYKKIRKLGDRYAFFLRKIKQEYGNNLLRLLYLTASSASSASS
jgi:hypothetical protein